MMRTLFMVVLFLASMSFDMKGNVSKDSIELESKEKITTDAHPLEPLLNAIIQVESKGNPKAYNKNGDCVGLLQITRVLVRECNNILKRRGETKRYSYEDRWCSVKSIEMFYLIQGSHNSNNNLYKGIRLWNKSKSYRNKILRIMDRKK